MEALIKKKAIEIKLIRENITYSAYLALVTLDDYEDIKRNVGSILNNEEQCVFNKMKYEKRKRDFLLGRYAGKLAVSSFCDGEELTHIHIGFGVFGQPIVKHQSKDTPEVSITHSQERAYAIAFPFGHQIGIDMEHQTKNLNALDAIKSQLTQNEINLSRILGIPESDAYVAFWTMKESLSKVLKCGLTVPFRLLEVTSPVVTNRWIEVQFKHFEQYKSYAYRREGHIFSLSMPKHTIIDGFVFENTYIYQHHSQ